MTKTQPTLGRLTRLGQRRTGGPPQPEGLPHVSRTEVA